LSAKLRPIAEPFVVAAPCGAPIRTRLAPSLDDEAVLMALGAHLASLAGKDLSQRCREGRLDIRERSVSRARRKRAATKDSSSRWAGTITRTSEDTWQLGRRNLGAAARTLRARVIAIQRRPAVPVGQRRGRTRGYGNAAERFEKQRRLQILQAKLGDVDARLAEGRVSICRGGKRLARSRHHLEEAGLSLAGGSLGEYPYRSGKRAMVKVKRWRSADLVVGGYLGPPGDPWSLLLGVYDGQGVLHHVGQTVSFSPRERVALRARLASLEGGRSFGGGLMPGLQRWEHQRFDSWVPLTPALVCEVDYSALDGRRFQHSARFIRWRPDQDPSDCTYCELPPLQPSLS